MATEGMRQDTNIHSSEEMVKKHQIKAVRHGLSQIAEDIAMLSCKAETTSLATVDQIQSKIAKIMYRMSVVYSMITDLYAKEPCNYQVYHAEGGR